jgi:flavin-dependent dehydrogenase
MERQNKREFIPFGETAGRAWKGFQLWRPTFDQILLDRANEVGCEFVAPCVASEAVRNARGVKIFTSAGTFDSRIVVDGTGRNRWLARRWRLPIRAFSSTLVARYEYARGNWSNLDDNPVFSPRKQGWEWAARVHEDLYQRITLRYAQNKQGFDKAPNGFEALRKVGRVRGADVTWTLIYRAASLRHFLVGDAAAVLDPSSSHGILRALSSGILVATCIAKIFGGDENSADSAVAGYNAWQRKWFLRDLQRMTSVKQKATHSEFARSSDAGLPSLSAPRDVAGTESTPCMGVGLGR